MGSRLSMNRCKSAPQGQGESDGFGAFLLSWKRPKRGEHSFKNHFVCPFCFGLTHFKRFSHACHFGNTLYRSRLRNTVGDTSTFATAGAWMVEGCTETVIRLLWNRPASQSLSLSLLNTLL